jgi:hypothetical protein
VLEATNTVNREIEWFMEAKMKQERCCLTVEKTVFLSQRYGLGIPCFQHSSESFSNGPTAESRPLPFSAPRHIESRLLPYPKVAVVGEAEVMMCGLSQAEDPRAFSHHDKY